jgi:Na+/H+ antiporter NhaB
MMRFLLVVVVVLVVVIVGVGFYRGWFSIASDSADGKGHITLTVDQKKIQDDEKAVQDRARNLGRSATNSGSAPAPAPQN